MGTKRSRPLLQPGQVRLLRRRPVLPGRAELHGAVRHQRRSEAQRRVERCRHHRRPGDAEQQARVHDVCQDRRAEYPLDAGLHQFQRQRRFSTRRRSRRSVRSFPGWRSSTRSMASTARSRVRAVADSVGWQRVIWRRAFPRLDYINKASIAKRRRHRPHRRRRSDDRRSRQYVARPPLISNTAPVENEHSSEESQQIRAATSSSSRKRPIGIRASM